MRGRRCTAAALLALACAPAFAQAAIDAPVGLPWSFREARLSCPAGFSGRLALYAVDEDGRRRLAFRAEPRLAYSLAAPYYDDGATVALELEATDGLGHPVSAAAYPARKPAVSQAEALASLPFSYRPPAILRGQLSVSVVIPRNDAEAAARACNELLFRAAANPVSGMLLVAWTLALALGWAALGDRTKRKGGLALLGALALGAAAAMVALNPPSADVFELGDALSGGPVTELPAPAGPPGVSLSTYSSTGGKDPRAGSLSYLGVRSPDTALVPLEQFSGYAGIRFSYPPAVVLGPDGVARLGTGPYLAAWALSAAGEAP